MSLQASPEPLVQAGFNIQVEITPSSVEVRADKEKLKSALVLAHLDTGASTSFIDSGLAEYLQLNPTGESRVHTAGGIHKTGNFAIDLYFPNTKLSGFQNLQIGSCYLGFDKETLLRNPADPFNAGFLLGRDIMAHWNIVWNGPTSTVHISD